jgi:hypothetical protein
MLKILISGPYSDGLSVELHKTSSIIYEHQWHINWRKNQNHCWVCNITCSHLGVTRFRILLWCTHWNWASKWTSLKIHVNFHSFSRVLCSTHISGNNCYKISKPENHVIISYNWQWQMTIFETIMDRNTLNTGLCKYFVQRFQNELYETSLSRTMWWLFCEFAPETIKEIWYNRRGWDGTVYTIKMKVNNFSLNESLFVGTFAKHISTQPISMQDSKNTTYIYYLFNKIHLPTSHIILHTNYFRDV